MEFTTHKESWVTYVPDFANNRSLPAEEMVSCKVHFLNYKEAQKYRSGLMLKGKSLRKGMKLDTAGSADKIFCDNVKEITNLVIDKEQVTTGELLLKLAEGPLIDMIEDINEAMEDVSHLKEGDIKNFGA